LKKKGGKGNSHLGSFRVFFGGGGGEKKGGGGIRNQETSSITGGVKKRGGGKLQKSSLYYFWTSGGGRGRGVTTFSGLEQRGLLNSLRLFQGADREEVT